MPAKPIALGGSAGRETATGDGIAIVTREYARHRNIQLDGATAAIQGFGNVGINTALAYRKLGIKVIAISDSRGAVYREDGIDIEALAKRKRERGTIADAEGHETISAGELLETKCDFLVPAALGNAVGIFHLRHWPSLPAARSKIRSIFSFSVCAVNGLTT